MVRRDGPPLPAGRHPLAVARYLAVRAGSGAAIATLRLATSAITKVHEWTGSELPCSETPLQGSGREGSAEGRGRRLARPQRPADALTADVLTVIWLTAVLINDN